MKPRLRFGDFVLDPGRHTLHRGGRRVALTPKPLETLIVLVENRGRTVDKRALLDAVWKDAAVSDGALVQAVREIRRALGDDLEEPAFVKTIPREGYRFVADVLELPDTAPRRRRAAPLVVAALAVAGIGSVLALRGLRRPGSSSSPGAPVSPRQITSGRNAVKPAYSPDGRLLLFAAPAPGSPGLLDLHLAPAEGGTAWRITERADASGDLPVFTPDGSHVVFSRYRSSPEDRGLPDLWRVPSVGGAPRLYVGEAAGAGFSPDGAQVAYTKHLPGRRALWLSPTGDLSRHVEIDATGFTPRWSADGRRIAYTTSHTEGGLGVLRVVSAALDERRALTSEPQQMYGLAWAADGRSIVFAARSDGHFHLYRVWLDGGRAEPLTSGVGDYSAPAASPDGSALAFSHSRPSKALVVTRRAESSESRVVAEDEDHHWPRFAPDGRRVASVVRRVGAEDELQVLDLETLQRTTLPERPARYPCWIDGSRLAYLRPEGTTATLVRVAEAASSEGSTWTRLEGEATGLAAHGAGERVAVVLRRAEGGSSIVVRDLRSGRDTRVASGGEYEGLRFDPAGERLAWSGAAVGGDLETQGVWVAASPRGEPHRIGDGYGPVWAPDGSLAISRPQGPEGTTGLWRLSWTGGGAARLRSWRRVKDFDLAGERLVFVREEGRSEIYSLHFGR